MNSPPCACGSGRKHEACCGPLHAGAAAPTAVALMRSRYAAFVTLNGPYLLATWHPGTRPARVEFEPRQQWLGLRIVSAAETGPDRAEVEFIARYRIGGAAAARHHERSRFVRENGRWYYLDGNFPG